MSKNLSNTCALQLKNIVKDYGQGEFLVHALKGINLSFRKNEFVSILGPSGCGKTTLLNIIGGLDRYTSGDLIIEGRSTKGYKDKDWDAYRNNCIGFVFQSYNLIPHQNVLGNVELALELSGISKKQRRNRALDILEKVGLKGLEHKKPNQLSGGQMQRVAIARALVNDPEIILADEPTGALDTETSAQVMDLLKEVAKDRLVIMVTHNPEIANKYSTRIINLLDGEMVGDSNPLNEQQTDQIKAMRKPKMGFKTAFALSIKNLFSKRARTILTSVAGSIGIIGVALVLALSNGFNGYMARMQTDTLATYPITISESSVDLSGFSEVYENELKEQYPELDNILVEKSFDKLTGMLVSNKLGDTSEKGFLHYLEQADKNLYYDIRYSYGFDMNDYFYTNIRLGTKDGQTTTYKENFVSIDTLVGNIEAMFNDQLQSAMGLNTDFVRQYIPTIQEMPNSQQLIKEQYDVIHGSLPTKANEIVLVVDKYNGINDITLALLGFLGVTFNPLGDVNTAVTFEDKETISLAEVMGKQIYLANNDVMYTQETNGFFNNQKLNVATAEQDGLEKLTVVGILRPKENSNGILNTGFAYTSQLKTNLLQKNKDSQIVKAINEGTFLPAQEGEVKGRYPINSYLYDPETGEKICHPVTNQPLLSTEYMPLRGIAGSVLTPSNISIYAKDFTCKEQIKAYLTEWNQVNVYQNYPNAENIDEYKITYSDMMSMMFGMLDTMVDAVTYVLIAFTSISLIVSSVMIGIITYISVVERTKEIGVLRSLGASKLEISNVFNAETFLIGLFAGLIGVIVTYLLSIPINILMATLVPSVGRIALLHPVAAIVLVLISITLTLIAGLIPARIAAKKDPVVALRTE